jgi:hypothetical protein
MKETTKNVLVSWYLVLYLVSFGILWLYYFFFDFKLNGLIFYSCLYGFFGFFTIWLIFNDKKKGVFKLR